MKTIVPYTNLSAATVEALADAREGFECVYVGDTDTEYFDLLRDVWAWGEDFAIVEHDVVVNPDTLQGFRDCPRLWCSAGYRYLRSSSYHGNGCVRYRREVMQAFPDVLEAAGEYSDAVHHKQHYCSLDSAMQRALRSRGVRRCEEHGTVFHPSPFPGHNCIPAQHLPVA